MREPAVIATQIIAVWSISLKPTPNAQTYSHTHTRTSLNRRPGNTPLTAGGNHWSHKLTMLISRQLHQQPAHGASTNKKRKCALLCMLYAVVKSNALGSRPATMTKTATKANSRNTHAMNTLSHTRSHTIGGRGTRFKGARTNTKHKKTQQHNTVVACECDTTNGTDQRSGAGETFRRSERTHARAEGTHADGSRC